MTKFYARYSAQVVSRAWQERNERIRAQIRQIALGLFTERGYDHVSIEEVANAAGVTSRTVFRYFPSKDALVLDSAGRETWDELLALLESGSLPGAPMTQIIGAFAMLAPSEDSMESERMRLLSRTPALWMVWRQAFKTLEPRLADWLVRRSAAPVSRDDALLVARLIVAAHEHAVSQWLDEPDPERRTIAGFVELESRVLEQLEHGVTRILGA